MVEGWRSLTTDPTNYSAHRLLADTYASRPRHEIARVSELLQSQLLQPLNITPVQPQLAEGDLFLLEGSGPAEHSFNEFNPLFTRNRLALQASGIVGGNDTFGEDVAQSGIVGPLSYSLGQFHLESDGFRDNNDIDVDIYNVFLQSAITPKLNLQAEYRRQEREQGDLQLRFDPDAFLPNERRSIEQDIVRLGARYSPTPSSELLVSSFYTERSETIEDLPVFLQGEAEGYQVEAQYIYNHPWFNGIAGGGIYRVDNESLFQFPGIVREDKFDDEHSNAYFYSNLSFPHAVTWTLGLSYDSISTPDQDLNKVSPKLGLQWRITDRARLRLAYFRTLKRVLSVEQTIEPTNIAGFNQFFDDANGTGTERYGIGLDATLTKELYGGLEYSQRELAVPGFSVSQGLPIKFDRDEKLARAYLYWTPHSHWAVSAETTFEEFKRPREDPTAVFDNAPIKVESVAVPLAVRYFHPSGFFTGIGGSFVYQHLDRLLESAREDAFFLLDTQLGYRLPKRRGVIRLEAKNLLDEDFFFQDLNIHNAREPQNALFIPDRTIFLRATFSFN